MNHGTLSFSSSSQSLNPHSTTKINGSQSSASSHLTIPKALVGLPVLPAHQSSVTVDHHQQLHLGQYQDDANLLHAWCIATSKNSTDTEDLEYGVDLWGEKCTKEMIRAELEDFYEDTNQLENMNEMTLRIDTELESLRRQCFAERNLMWNTYTPDMFEYVPRIKRSIIWEKQSLSIISTKDKNAPSMDEKEILAEKIGEYARERPWPPKEFSIKQNSKAGRGRSSKRKTPSVFAEEKPLFGRICIQCHTQDSSLWHRRQRQILLPPPRPRPQPQPSPPPSLAPGMTTILPHGLTNQLKQEVIVPVGMIEPQYETIEEDLCMGCFLRLEKKNLFQAEKSKRTKLKKEKDQFVFKIGKEELLKLRLQEEALTTTVATTTTTTASITAAGAVAANTVDKQRKKDKKKQKKHKKEKKKNKRKYEDMMENDNVDMNLNTHALPSFEESIASNTLREIDTSTNNEEGKKKKQNALKKTTSSISVTSTPTSSSASTKTLKKSTSSKKINARERELRALGQYCPVCNEVYENDDESSFVCCDSCEMWIHEACDPKLTAASIEELSTSNKKYICPLCAGV
jgi:hypothetical protein